MSGKTYLAKHRKHGWRYRRAVPRDLVAAVGKAEWSAYLGQTAKAAAEARARSMAVRHDGLITRLRSLPAVERKRVAGMGGIDGAAALVDGTDHGLIFLDHLASNAGKPQRERLTFMRMFEELRLSGYAGGYDAIRRYARAWERQQGVRTAEAYVPLSFAPGEAYQFDWSHEVVVLDGATNVVKVAQVRLCYSRMLFVRAYPREAQEMVFDAHDRAFAFFRGACERGVNRPAPDTSIGAEK